MDTKEVAEHLGTTPRTLRQFLRSDYSTFVAVGSGARYEFTERDLTTVVERFNKWRNDGKPRPDTDRQRTVKAATRASRSSVSKDDRQRQADEKVWAEEGPVEIPDIRDPRVRARVKADAAAADARLEQRLIAAGMHLFQLGDRRSA